ncbi:MAG: YXWGXW repeat-containing protein [Planctomycetes bacterium]|nr:YXWGXW repeat-containing protein [Planctomycetota bacterium]
MSIPASRIALICTVLAACFVCAGLSTSQQPGLQGPVQAPGEVPKGVEVLTRGPIHEAFASPTTEPKATPQIAKKPPVPIEELPPEEKPEGDVIWIGGYFAFDDDRADFLWVSGCWRVKPTGKEWVPGYWRETNTMWQWVPGFWTNATQARAEPITYYPTPPAPPNIAPPAAPAELDMIQVPGYWQWTGDRYVWRAGYVTRVRPGFVYVASHYRWTPYGHVFVAGYWDYAVSRRGVLYAPVTVDVVVVGPRYVYTPYYAVRDTIVLDTLFVRPAYGAYYFGDYYGPRYVAFGFEPCVVYSRRHYEPIIVYERWERRDNPRWHDAQVTLVIERNAGRAPVPPRTLVQQTTIVQNNVNITNVTNVIAPTKTVVVARGEKTVPLSTATRAQVAQTSQASQQALMADRRKTESAPASATPLTKPRIAAINVPTTTPVGSPTTPIGGTKTPVVGGNPMTTKDPGKIGTTPIDPRIPPIGPKVTPKDTKKGTDDKKKKN